MNGYLVLIQIFTYFTNHFNNEWIMVANDPPARTSNLEFSDENRKPLNSGLYRFMNHGTTVQQNSRPESEHYTVSQGRLENLRSPGQTNIKEGPSHDAMTALIEYIDLLPPTPPSRVGTRTKCPSCSWNVSVSDRFSFASIMHGPWISP